MAIWDFNRVERWRSTTKALSVLSKITEERVVMREKYSLPITKSYCLSDEELSTRNAFTAAEKSRNDRSFSASRDNVILSR